MTERSQAPKRRAILVEFESVAPDFRGLNDSFNGVYDRVSKVHARRPDFMGLVDDLWPPGNDRIQRWEPSLLIDEKPRIEIPPWVTEQEAAARLVEFRRLTNEAYLTEDFLPFVHAWTVKGYLIGLFSRRADTSAIQALLDLLELTGLVHPLGADVGMAPQWIRSLQGDSGFEERGSFLICSNIISAQSFSSLLNLARYVVDRKGELTEESAAPVRPIRDLFCFGAEMAVADRSMTDAAVHTSSGPERYRLLGVDPETGRSVTLRTGPFGRYVQIGTADDAAKPRSVQIYLQQQLRDIALEKGINPSELTRNLGKTAEGLSVSIEVGWLGSYVLYGDKYALIGDDDDPYTIELPRALELIADTNRVILDFSEAGIQVRKGIEETYEWFTRQLPG